MGRARTKNSAVPHREVRMEYSTETLNELWAQEMIQELVHHGVRMFCISPGSRSTPLTIAAAKHPLATTHVHFDERGMGFHALGYAKASEQPVVLIVTSGTAVANLLPAVMEAHYDQVSLIILTADRPPELRDTGANQTSNQVKIFQDFVRWQADLPCPDSKIPLSFIGTTISHAIAHTTSVPAGPVHLNCMLREPFMSEDSTMQQSSHLHAKTAFISGECALKEQEYKQLAEELCVYEKGAILISGTTPIQALEPLYNLSRLLQWPIFPDILSNVRWNGTGYGVTPYYDLALKSQKLEDAFVPEAILQIGDRFVSKKLLEWISSKKTQVHCHVAPHIYRKDPTHSVTHRIACDVNHFIKHFSSYLSGRSPSNWFQTWKELSDLTAQALHLFFHETQELSEPLLFHHLASVLSDSTALFLSNSMPIRNADAFFCPKHPVGPIHCNRGLSGIDGNIATASGVTQGLKKPVIAILGDLAFLHDINSLATVKKLPLKLLVINNGGGSIFSFLPIAKKESLLTPYFSTPHNFEIEHAASLFGLTYENPKTLDTLQEILDQNTSNLIEISTPLEQNREIHQKILLHLKTTLTPLTMTM